MTYTPEQLADFVSGANTGTPPGEEMFESFKSDPDGQVARFVAEAAAQMDRVLRSDPRRVIAMALEADADDEADAVLQTAIAEDCEAALHELHRQTESRYPPTREARSAAIAAAWARTTGPLRREFYLRAARVIAAYAGSTNAPARSETLHQAADETIPGGDPTAHSGESITKLEEIDERCYEVFLLHEFAGQSVDSIAELLAVSPDVVSRDLAFAEVTLPSFEKPSA